MGRETVRAVHQAPDMSVVAGVGRSEVGADVGELAGLGPIGAPVVGTVAEGLAFKPDAAVDFTTAEAVEANIDACLDAGVGVVAGATGLPDAAWERIGRRAARKGLGVIYAPNFALGAVLMMRFAKEAARYFPNAEIIELHHERKRDAPSGTARHTAALIAEAWSEAEAASSLQAAAADGIQGDEEEAGARGALCNGVHVHSVRMPGLVAHQEVVLGLPGQTLTLRHDSFDRASFMPGVLLALRRLGAVRGLVRGLEPLLFQKHSPQSSIG